MAPRIANDSYPDELLAVEHADLGPVAPPALAGGGLGGGVGAHPAATPAATVAADLALEADAGAAAAAAVAMADAELEGQPGANTGGDAHGLPAHAVDPLAMGRPAGPPAIHPSHSSGSDVVMGHPTLGTVDTGLGTMGTTVTVDMAHAAQRAWEAFAAGQEEQAMMAPPQAALQPMATEGTAGPALHVAPGVSPASMPATSPSAASLAAFHGSPPVPGAGWPNGNETPTTYQQLLLQQRQDLLHSGMSVSSAPAAAGAIALAADRMPIAQQRRASSQTGHAAITGEPVPRASSFGGFPAPPRNPSRPASAFAGDHPPLAPALEDAQADSAASSLTGSLPYDRSASLHSSTHTASYQRFLSGLEHQASTPLETIPPSEGDENSPQETVASLHSAGAFSTSAGMRTPDSKPGSEDSKMSPGETSPGNGSFAHSPKLPYSPSLLDRTSFPEEEEGSLDGAGDEAGGDDKYSPVSKLDFADEGKMDATAATADATLDESHVVHEDEALPTMTALRPRPSPFAHSSISSGTSGHNSQGSQGSHALQTGASDGVAPSTQLVRNEAFEHSPAQRPQYRHQISDVSVDADGSVQLHAQTPPPLAFGPETTIADLTRHAEQGRVVDVLAALTTPRLQTLGARMLADYAKMPNRRAAVASNPKILEFVQTAALEVGNTISPQYAPASPGSRERHHEHAAEYASPGWLGREYAVETVRSLTAAEENDRYLMTAPGLLRTLALVARGGPFVRRAAASMFGEPSVVAVAPPQFNDDGSAPLRDEAVSAASDKARLHACIAIMNLSCGKGNKAEIARVPEVLEGMRDVMLGRHFGSPPKTSLSGSRAAGNVSDEARLKATTCIKNLSNADANDAALLGTPGLIETLGYVAEATCHPHTGATTCTTHACLALMNLSISKANKHRVFRTPGVMDALMAVIARTAPKANNHANANSGERNPKDPNFEARIKACSALSNLAIGYDNKIPMFNYPGFVEGILAVIRTDAAEARTKACSILWSFAAEMKNQVPVVRRGDILPALVAVAREDGTTEARFKCVAALTLLAESPENAVPLLEAGSLEPLMHVLQEAGPDPTQWRGQTASWCVGFLMNMAQCDDVVPALLREGIVDLLAPLLSLDHYQSLKAAMAVTFVCQYDTGDKTYNLLRQTENVIPKIVGLLHNTLSGRGGSGYKYGVFTLRSSVGCIASLAAGPDFMKERIATDPVFESLLKVVEDFCVDGGTPGAIVGGGKDDARSVTLAVRALSMLVGHLIPEPGCAAMPFGPAMDDQLVVALRSFEQSAHPEIGDATKEMAHQARIRVEGGKDLGRGKSGSVSSESHPDDLSDDGGGIALGLARRFFPFPCGMNLHVPSDPAPAPPALPAPPKEDTAMDVSDDAAPLDDGEKVRSPAVRTFLLTDATTGRRYCVPCDPAGGRQFNDRRVWCFRRGRWCEGDEMPDPNFQWSDELQAAYMAALGGNGGNGNISEES
ncbi:hypothetical protein ACHAXT_008761 [Thalassiosira profunda]